MQSTLSICASCGDRIGYYEPIWLQRSDGSLVSTGLLRLPPGAESEPDVRLFHLECLSLNGAGPSDER